MRCCGAVVTTTVKLHSLKSELWFCAVSNPPCGMTKIIKTKNNKKIIIKTKQKKNKNTNFKSNIYVKAMTPREHQKSCSSNLLVSIKYLIVASYQNFLYHKKGFQLAGHYSNLKYWKQ